MKKQFILAATALMMAVGIAGGVEAQAASKTVDIGRASCRERVS